jgi:FkbM family methyltransferase
MPREAMSTRLLALGDPLLRARDFATLDDIEIEIGPHLSSRVLFEMRIGRYERRERRAIIPALRDDDVVLELGVGIGLVSMLCVRRLGPGRVFGFEANPRLAPYLEANFARNDLYPHVTFAVLGETKGERVFHIEPSFFGSSLHKRSQGAETIAVPMHAFADVRAKRRPTVLVADIEGGEVELCAHAALDGIRLVVMELHPHIVGAAAIDTVVARVRAQGFVTEVSAGGAILVARR